MATSQIIINVRTRGGNTATRQLSSIRRSLRGIRATATLVRTALTALASGAAISGAIRLVDAYTNIQNRLRITTRTTGELRVAQERLFQIANRTGTGFATTVELFARSSNVFATLGRSQQDAIRFTDLFSQAVAQSGASTIEADNATRQFLQGLASERLGGEELRSVLEQLPIVADIIANSLNVTRGELRGLGADGALTPRVILDAFNQAASGIEAGFGSVVPTVSRSFTVLRNNVIQGLGSFLQSSGVTSTFSSIIFELSKNLDLVGRAFASVATTIATVYVAKGISVAIAATTRFAAVLSTGNIFAAVGIGAAAAVGLLVSFSDQLRLSGQGAATLADLFVVSFQSIGSSISGFLIPVFNTLGAQSNTFAGIFAETFTGILRTGAETFDAFATIGIRTVNVLIAVFSTITAPIQNIFTGLFNIVSVILNRIIEQVARVANAIGSVAGFSPITVPEIPRLDFVETPNILTGAQEALATPAFTGAQDFVRNALGSAEVRATNRQLRAANEARENELATASLATAPAARPVAPANNRNRRQPPTFASVLTDLDREIDLLQLSSAEYERRQDILQIENEIKRSLTPVETDLANARLREIQSLQTQNTVLEEIRGPAIEYAERLSAIEALNQRVTLTTDEYTRAVRGVQLAYLETQTTAAAGFQAGLLTIQEQFTDLSGIARDGLVNAFQSAEDAIVNFATTGQLSFRGFVDSVINDIARLAVRQSITAPIASAIGGLGGGGGGIFGSLLGGLFGGGGGATAATATNSQILAGVGNPLGFAEGGSFRVRGSGGADSRLVPLRLTPGELVDITPQGQERRNRGGTVNITYNINTPDAESFGRSQAQILRRTQQAIDSSP